ncbi:unnamed protein product [Blepharisma stoltei]|uniref:Uncharacterized protein n=1 Tax=Blepharisma stoltei TaxID=1481888 RepID=A0AAU9KD10_9CILI|nr:unnamed protein product [Blepharisma stoltei]
MRCWKSDCYEKIEVYCPHEKSCILSCSLHIGAHIITKSEDGHHPEAIYSDSACEGKSPFISHLVAAIMASYKAKTELMKEFKAKLSTLVNLYIREFKQISCAQSEFIGMLNQLIPSSQIRSLSFDEFPKITGKSSFMFNNKIKPIDKSNEIELEAFEYSESTDQNDLSIKAPNPKEKINKSLPPEIVIFDHNTDKFLKINLKSLEATTKSFNLKSVSLKGLIICEIQDNKYFCHHSNKLGSRTFIIDFDDHIKFIESGNYCSATYAYFYKYSVYLFGGKNSNNEPMSLAIRFHTVNEKWQKISPIPKPASFISCVSSQYKLLFSGFEHSKLYSYSIRRGNYNELLELKPNSPKILCKSSTTIFVSDSDYIWKSEVNSNSATWQKIGRSPMLPHWSLSNYTYYAMSIYFVDEEFNMYQFNLKEMSMSKLDFSII